MKSEGKKFEEDIWNSIPEEIWKYRLRDNPGVWGGGKQLRFSSSNICDFLIYPPHLLIGIECKSHKGRSIPFSNFKEHQTKGLIDLDSKGGWGLFIVNFRDHSLTYHINARDIKKFIETSQRKSLSLEMAEQTGELIPQFLKRTRYRYDLTGIL